RPGPRDAREPEDLAAGYRYAAHRPVDHVRPQSRAATPELAQQEYGIGHPPLPAGERGLQGSSRRCLCLRGEPARRARLLPGLRWNQQAVSDEGPPTLLLQSPAAQETGA